MHCFNGESFFSRRNRDDVLANVSMFSLRIVFLIFFQASITFKNETLEQFSSYQKDIIKVLKLLESENIIEGKKINLRGRKNILGEKNYLGGNKFIF